MSDDAQGTEVSEELRKLAEQHDAILAALAVIKDSLGAGEKRRRCMWVLSNIDQTMIRLKQLFPEREKIFSEILESLACYVNLNFESTEDLHTLHTCLVLVAGSLEESGKDGISAEQFRLHVNLTYKMLNELQTLEDGDPPGMFSAVEKLMRDDDSRHAERKAVRERVAELSRVRIKEMFARRREQESEFY